MIIESIVLYSIIFILLLLIEITFLNVAKKLGITDASTCNPSTHKVIITAGGIIFPFSVMTWGCFYGFHFHLFLLGLLILCATCLIDDIKETPIKYRLIAQFCAVALLIFQFYNWSDINIWLFSLLIIMGVAIINEFNFMDGIDGITGFYALSVLIPLMMLNYKINFIDWAFLIILLFGILIFSFFNLTSFLRCFAGDTGSVCIAYIFTFLIGGAIICSDSVWWIMFIAVYAADASFTILTRIAHKENLFSKHQSHLYQMMAINLKMPHIAISLSYFSLQLLISLGLIYLPVNKAIYSICIIIALGILYFTLRMKISGGKRLLS